MEWPGMPAPPFRRASVYRKAALPAMTEDEVLAEFRASQALLEGHFVLSSGRHSAYYLQCARMLMDPDRASRLAFALGQKIPRELRTQIPPSTGWPLIHSGPSGV